MPFPPSIKTRTVTLGGAMTMENAEPLSLRVTVLASRSLVWNESGYWFKDFGVTTLAAAGGEVMFTLPATDLQGWRDPVANELVDVSALGSYSHTYTAYVQVGEEGAPVVVGPFIVPTGDGSPVDLDTMLPAITVAGDQIAIPDSWSAQVAAAQKEAAEAAQAARDVAEAAVSVGGAVEVATAAARESLEARQAAAAAAHGAGDSAASANLASASASISKDAALSAAADARESKVGAQAAREQAQAVAASKGQANGIGSLDASGKQPESQVLTRLGAAALATSFAPARRSVKFAVLGDSNSETSNNMQNWHTYLSALCEGRALWGGYFATAGFTLANIRDTHLPSVLALSGYSKPGMVIIAGGTNPIDTVNFTIAGQLAVLKDICAQLEAAGIAPVLVAIPPRHDGANGTAQAAVNAYTRRWNAAVANLAAERRYKLLPFFRAMVDTATGLMKTTHQTGDNIHFSQAGHAAIAQACAPVLLDGLPLRSDFILSTDELDTANLSDRPRLALGGGTSQGVGGNANVAYAWALLSTGTVEAARVAAADDPNFFWQEGKNPAASVLFQKTGIPVVPGNRIAISQWLRIPEGLIDSTVTFGNSFEFRTAANASAGFAPAQSIPLAQVKADLGTGALFSYAEVIVPATAATLRFNSTISKGRIAFSRPTVRDLTALGIAG